MLAARKRRTCRTNGPGAQRPLDAEVRDVRAGAALNAPRVRASFMLRLSSGERPLRRAGLQIARHLRRTIHGSVCLAQSLWVGLLLLTIAVELGLGAPGARGRPACARRGEVRTETKSAGTRHRAWHSDSGRFNAITDVEGVLVGHVTLIRGERIRTGVTQIMPHGGNIYQNKVPAGIVVGNGFGKFAGSTQIEELGELETPIVLNGTPSLFPPQPKD